MSPIFSRFTAMLACVALVACTTTTPLPDSALKSSSGAKIVPTTVLVGDKLTVRTVDGRSRQMLVTGTSPEALTGTDADTKEPVRVAAADIASLGRVVPDKAGTVGIVAIVALAALAAFALKALSNPDSWFPTKK
jgi:hypothetical protein